MNKSALLFAVGSVFVFGLPLVASAFDDDPGYGPNRPRNSGADQTWRGDFEGAGQGMRGWYGGEDRFGRGNGAQYERDRNIEPIYYRATQRYYAKGYTVSYRYIPMYYSEVYGAQRNESSNFRAEGFRIEARDVPPWGAKAPRVIVANRRNPSQTALTKIVPAYSSTQSNTTPTGSGMTEVRRSIAPAPTSSLEALTLDPDPIPAKVADPVPAKPSVPEKAPVVEKAAEATPTKP